MERYRGDVPAPVGNVIPGMCLCGTANRGGEAGKARLASHLLGREHEESTE